MTSLTTVPSITLTVYVLLRSPYTARTVYIPVLKSAGIGTGLNCLAFSAAAAALLNLATSPGSVLGMVTSLIDSELASVNIDIFFS